MTKLQIALPEKAGQTKIQQLVQAVTGAIANGQLNQGEPLPSINQLSKQCRCSRDTVFKAYKALQQQNLIESAPTRGYYVTGGAFKVFMLLDDFSAFKEQLYHSFRSSLPKSYSVDLLFHHYNRDVFSQLIHSSLGRYSVYVVMNIDHNKTEPVLGAIDPEKLLILDMGMPASANISYVVQDFNHAVENCLMDGSSLLKKYNKLVLVYDEKETPHPAETTLAVQRFCQSNGIEYKQVKAVGSTRVKKGECWFTIRDSDLVDVIKMCREKGFQTGSDVGILSYNDTPMKQIVGGGISVISTDFVKMGRLAAGFVKNRQKIAKVLPTSLILRASI